MLSCCAEHTNFYINNAFLPVLLFLFLLKIFLYVGFAGISHRL